MNPDTGACFKYDRKVNHATRSRRVSASRTDATRRECVVNALFPACYQTRKGETISAWTLPISASASYFVHTIIGIARCQATHVLLRETEHSSRRCGCENLIKTASPGVRASLPRTTRVADGGSVLVLPWPNGKSRGEELYERFVVKGTVSAESSCPLFFLSPPWFSYQENGA